MKKSVLFLFFVFTAGLFSQSFSVFDVDNSNYPIMKAKFYALDKDEKQILNLSSSDFEVIENGNTRKILNVSCPVQKPPEVVSVAMSIDVSGSMAYSQTGEIPVELGKITAKEICGKIAMPPSEFALQTCDNKARILQDFTTGRNVILSKIEPVKAYGDNDFVEHLLNPLTGLLNIAKTGKHDRVAILYTDAWWYPLKDVELRQCIDTCIKYGIRFFAIIYSRPEAQSDGIKKSFQSLAEATGGILFDGVTTMTVAREIGVLLQRNVQETDPCIIEWESAPSCSAGITNVELQITNLNLTTIASYLSSSKSLAKLEFNPTLVKFTDPVVGVKAEQKVTVTARNADFTVTNITSNNPAFVISPKSFTLNSGQSIEIKVSYIPADSGYNYCRFDVDCSPCPSRFFASGGWKGKKPSIRTLKLIHPNGGEVFVAGSDTVITWDGVSPDEPVKLEYTTNNGSNWTKIADNAVGLSYNWHVPKTPSNLCLARVTATTVQQSSYCVNSDVELSGKIWMGCNLDVDFYRDGSPIRHCQTDADWIDASNKNVGAWCYYNNDPANGEIYGKLYNWYAVIDPRGLAPEGWHIPTDDEWTELENCLGGSSVAGGKLKSIGTIQGGDGLWRTPNEGATNESGFSALPGGYRIDYGLFLALGNNGIWWSATGVIGSGGVGILRSLSSSLSSISRWYTNKESGYSVRCVRD